LPRQSLRNSGPGVGWVTTPAEIPFLAMDFMRGRSLLRTQTTVSLLQQFLPGLRESHKL
jgi:hypothetical protein